MSENKENVVENENPFIKQDDDFSSILARFQEKAEVMSPEEERESLRERYGDRVFACPCCGFPRSVKSSWPEETTYFKTEDSDVNMSLITGNLPSISECICCRYPSIPWSDTVPVSEKMVTAKINEKWMDSDRRKNMEDEIRKDPEKWPIIRLREFIAVRESEDADKDKGWLQEKNQVLFDLYRLKGCLEFKDGLKDDAKISFKKAIPYYEKFISDDFCKTAHRYMTDRVDVYQFIRYIDLARCAGEVKKAKEVVSFIDMFFDKENRLFTKNIGSYEIDEAELEKAYDDINLVYATCIKILDKEKELLEAGNFDPIFDVSDFV